MRFDIYRKIPKDLTQPTTTGAVISICCCLFMFLLFFSELLSFISVEVVSELFVDNPSSVTDKIPVAFSSLWELVVPFTRDFESIKSALFCIENYDKTCIETALDSVRSIVMEEWGAGVPCQVVLFTDGSTGIGPTSLKYGLANLSEAGNFPLPYPFQCKIHIVCLGTNQELVESIPLYEKLLEINGCGGSIQVPESLTIKSVQQTITKFTNAHYQAFHGTLKCGNLNSLITLFPSPVNYEKAHDFSTVKRKIASEINVCGFMDMSDIGSPCAFTRHLVLPIAPNSDDESTNQKDTNKVDASDNGSDEETSTSSSDDGKVPNFCVLLHGSLKVETMVAICEVGTGDLDGRPLLSSGPIWADDDDDEFVAAILDFDDEKTLGFDEDYPSDELETDSDDNVDNDNDSESDSDNPVDRLPVRPVIGHNLDSGWNKKEDWYGMLYSWADTRKKSNLMLTVFEPGDSIPWIGSFKELTPISCFETSPYSEASPFPVKKGTEKKSYVQNCVVWIKQSGLQADIQKVLRHARKLPEKNQHFYRVSEILSRQKALDIQSSFSQAFLFCMASAVPTELNKVRRAALSFGFYQLLERMASILERECTQLPGTAHPEAAIQLSYAANALISPSCLDIKHTIFPMRTSFGNDT
ncbi:Integrator complex subunit 14 [Nymphon striatum]|nr:Integrator complex subunit 14 [Nymphon striatum]